MLLSLTQQPLYRASAEVLVNQANLAATLSGIEDPTVFSDPVRFTQTQVDLAETPAVTRRVSEATRIRVDLLPDVNVAARENSNILQFTVSNRNGDLAERLATEYARQFVRHRYELDTAALKRAREEVAQRMRDVRSESGEESSFYRELLEREQQLRTMEALATSNASLVRAADDAVQIAPRPVRNGILALGLGIVFGIALAFLWETLDTRVRSSEEIGERLRLPLLARLPEPPRRLQRDNKLVMLEEPSSRIAEAFRMLRTNLDFVNLSRQPRTDGVRDVDSRSREPDGAVAEGSDVVLPAAAPSTLKADALPVARSIMVTSAVEQEGKSTTVANLAVAFARAGRHVVLVDLDLRRPFLYEFFALDPRPGLTDVALGEVGLEDALAAISKAPTSTSSVDRGRPAFFSNGGQRAEGEGVLELLTTGPLPPDAGEFVGTRVLAGILAELRERADIVLIDAPPMLHVGDAMTLSAQVDALMVVTRFGVVRRPMLAELRRLLEASPAEKLGFVVTAADLEKGDGYRYGYGYEYYRPRRSESVESVPAQP